MNSNEIFGFRLIIHQVVQQETTSSTMVCIEIGIDDIDTSISDKQDI